MNSTTHKLNLRVPLQTLETLSFAEATEKGISQWLGNLPKANIGETARQLYKGLIELNQLIIAPEKRLALLELIRPEVRYVCVALSKYYLGQSIVLEDKPRKVANLSQSLQNHLANGYKIIVAQEQSIRPKEHATVMALALERAIRGLCGPLLRAYQLYCPVADGVWLEMHQLYQLARRRRLHKQPIPDAENSAGHALSIRHCYTMALLMGAARPNQMRQSAMGKLFATLEDWSRRVHLVDPGDPDALFIINPDMDCAPRYRSLIRDEDISASVGLATRGLVEEIKDFMLNGAEAGSSLKIPDDFGVELLQHVSQSWGDLAERTFNRVPGNGAMRLSIGMSATHYRISGMSFSKFVATDEAELNPFSDAARRARKEGWDSAFDTDKSIDWAPSNMEMIDYTTATAPDTPANRQSEDDQYPVHTLNIVNHSPGGFCLTWPRDVPKQLQAGELLGVQEVNGQDWSLAVVRWIRQVRGGGTQMGIELVAPHCTPCAIKLIRKSEQPSQYLRALTVPAVAAIDRPPTIITPRLPFQVGSKVLIHQGHKEARAQLVDRITATGSFSQFEHRFLDPMAGTDRRAGGRPGTPGGGEDDFDSLWKTL
ncbi:MAG: molecular chaperone [Pseudomonas profundi]|uniref:molecular chaperone n=1 Tax=Pseudomonas profundi TaxID=1981513 RepID=UPI003001AB3A